MHESEEVLPSVNIPPSRRSGAEVIYIVKAQSFLRSPWVSLIVEGEDWLVGFDPIFEVMDGTDEETILEFDGMSGYPASRIIAHRHDGFEVQLSLKGFDQVTPRVKVDDGFLVVTGTKTEYAQHQNQNYLQRGISARGFRRSFQLGRDKCVVGTDLHHGILRIEIEQAEPSSIQPVASWERVG
jgi:molecular chaperone IbpA